MYPSADARQLLILLRIGTDLDIVGDVTVTVNDPSELLAWTNLMPDCALLAWRAADSGRRYVNVSAHRQRNPVHGHITAVLRADDHREFWDELIPETDLPPGTEQVLIRRDLARAWNAMSITPPD